MLRPDSIKLDRAPSPGFQSTRRVVLLCRARVVAEQMDAVVIGDGVEHDDEFDALLQLGVHAVQGYLFARPSSSSETGTAGRKAFRSTGNN